MAPPTPAAHANGRMSLGKYVKRMSSVFKREKPAKSTATSGPVPVSASASAPAPEPQPQPAKAEATKEQQEATKEQQEATKEEQEATEEQLEATKEKEEATNEQQEATKEKEEATNENAEATKETGEGARQLTDRNAMQQERARALFAKYGLTLESHEWIATPAPIPAVQRVEKSIRMRVHRSCHRCGTIYGSDKLCFKCEHKRCKKCPRYPKKKTPEEKQKDKDAADKPKRKKLLTITTKAGTEMVYQPPKQRLRRTCHKCNTLFVPPTATTCDQCCHVRCTKCPREPAKLTKWPMGYPGDVNDPDSSPDDKDEQLGNFRRTWRKPRARVRWECEKCHSLFLNHSPQCPGCGHERCDKCSRSPVKKVKKEDHFDPHIVAAVEAKLRALAVDDDTNTSGPEAA